jgi:putative phosphonate metabolism protein
MTSRFAVYFVPSPDSPLGQFGRAWLGRCADSGERVPPLEASGLDIEEARALTETPRLYGWHATLKPPFVLRDGESEAALFDALDALAARCAAVQAPPLVLQALGQFLALVPERPCAALDALAAECVVALDEFRQPPDAVELDRRRAAGLSPRQETLLVRWGYPYVIDEFRFHMTLTDPLDDVTKARVARLLDPLVSPFAQAPLCIDQLVLCRQDRIGAPFRVMKRYGLAGASASSNATKRDIETSTGALLTKATMSGPAGA